MSRPNVSMWLEALCFQLSIRPIVVNVISLNASRECLQICYQHSLRIKDELIRFWCPEFQGQGHSDLMFLWYFIFCRFELPVFSKTRTSNMTSMSVLQDPLVPVPYYLWYQSQTQEDLLFDWQQRYHTHTHTQPAVLPHHKGVTVTGFSSREAMWVFWEILFLFHKGFR